MSSKKRVNMNKTHSPPLRRIKWTLNNWNDFLFTKIKKDDKVANWKRGLVSRDSARLSRSHGLALNAMVFIEPYLTNALIRWIDWCLEMANFRKMSFFLHKATPLSQSEQRHPPQPSPQFAVFSNLPQSETTTKWHSISMSTNLQLTISKQHKGTANKAMKIELN